MVRFRINWDKTIEAIDLLARHQSGITQYYVGKVCYFADKEHLLDYGRPVTGDRYVAMEHGPVPSSIRNLLSGDTGLPDDILSAFYDRVKIKKVQNLQHASSRNRGDFEHLSGSEQEYLLASLHKYGTMGFAELRRVSHDDAWERAWAEPGIANEMDPLAWLDELEEEGARDAAVTYLSDRRVRTA